MAEESNIKLKNELELNNSKSMRNISTKEEQPLTQTPIAKFSDLTTSPKENTIQKTNLPQTQSSVENATGQSPTPDNAKAPSNAENSPNTNRVTQKINPKLAKSTTQGITHDNTVNANLPNIQTANLRSKLPAKTREDTKEASGPGKTSRVGIIKEKIALRKLLHVISCTTVSQKVTNIIKAAWSSIWNLIWPIAATLLFVIVTPILIRSTTVGWPLSKLTPAMGTLLLTVFSKFTDYVLDWSSYKVWEMVHWGPLLKKGEDLLTFLALTSDVDGWARLACLGFSDLFHCKNSDKDIEKGKCFQMKKKHDASRDHQLGVQGPPDGSLQTGQAKSSKGVFKYIRKFRVWSLARIVIWGVIQFPAVIMMSIVNQEIDYIPANWTEISGGLGVFNTSTVTEVIGQPSLWAYVFFLIRDATMSYQIDPVSAECGISDSCASFLFPGGLKTMAPWQYSGSADQNFPAYITKDAPAYQIDVWDAPSDIQWDPDACTIYGRDNQTAFQLCISYSIGRTDQLVAGWRICSSTVLISGECSQAGSWSTSHTWATYFTFNRRLATVAFDRFTSQILKVQSLGSPIAQEIPPSNFSAAINAMICPLTNGTDISTYCIGNGALAQLTSDIFVDLLFGAAASARSIPLDDLRNLFATSLIFFNPVSSGLESGPKPYSIQPGLQPENYFLGSPARPIMFVAPELWTSEVYAAVMGALILFGWAVIIWANKQHPQECGPFPFVNYLGLKWGSGDGNFDIKKYFEEGRKEEEKGMLRKSSDITLKLKGDEMEAKRTTG